MAVYEIGNYIHDLRIELGYSQEDLCMGICSNSNLSKIENGTRMPNRKTVEAMMQRLGCGEIFLQYSTKEEMKQVEICNQIVEKIAMRKYEGVEELVEKFEATISDGDILNSQYCRFAKTLIGEYKGMPPEHVLKELENTIRMTKPGYREGTGISGGLLTYNEIVILTNISNYYAKTDRTKALNILFRLKEYMDTHIMDLNEKMKKYPLILFNLSNLLIDEKRYDESLEMCDVGITLCKNNNRLRLFPNFLSNKGICLLELGRQEQAKDLLRKAYYVFAAMEEDIICEELKKRIEDEYQQTFI